VVDLPGRLVVGAAALAGLVAVGPLVVARRVDEGALERRPEAEDLAVVRLGAELLAGLDVADLQHERDLPVGVDAGDEARRGLRLRRIGGGRAVGRVAVDGEGSGDELRSKTVSCPATAVVAERTRAEVRVAVAKVRMDGLLLPKRPRNYGSHRA